MSSAEPARYYPFVYDGGRYAVKAGLFPLDTDFGNGGADRTVFQRDRLHGTYSAAKREAAAAAAAGPAALGVAIDEGARPEVLRAVLAYLRAQLVREGHFRKGELAGWGLDELAMHLQEDVAIVETGAGRRPRLTYQHVALPSGWSPWSKRGKTFAEVHKPVPGSAGIDGDALMRAVVARGDVRGRFVWGLQFDAGLDQHPRRGRRTTFDPAAGLWLRVERQILVGLAGVEAMLFLIHPYVLAIADVCADGGRARALLAAVESMSDAELRYKGLRRDRDAVVSVLRTYGGAR